MKANPPIFETYLVVDGKPLEAERHVKRMRDASGIDSTAYLHSAAKLLPDGYCSLRIICAPSGELSSSSAILDTPEIFQGVLGSLTLATRQFPGAMRHSGFGDLKVTDRAILEAIESEAKPAMPLMVDDTNTLLETTRHSIFIAEGDAVVTPLSDGRILPGATAGAVLELCKANGITYSEEAISLERALQSDGLFTTNPLSAILWVKQLDHKRWPEAPGVVKTLHGLLAERWKQQSA